MDIQDRITNIKGIGPKKAKALERMKIQTIEDFLCFYPRDYEDRRNLCTIRDLTEGATALIRGKITLIVKSGYGYGMRQTIKLLVTDETGGIEVVFFHAPFLEKSLQKDVLYEFYGRVSSRVDRLQMTHPDFHRYNENQIAGILPVYPLTQGISQGEMRKWQKEVAAFIGEMEDYIPEDIIVRNRLCSLKYAISHIHFPIDMQKVKEAKFRLVFDELFLLQLGLLSVKRRVNHDAEGIQFERNIELEAFTDRLPFTLTAAQQRVMSEIEKDMESNHIMNRLVQGDVGSGKTVVAAAAVYKAVKSGFQAVMMAPTELLARQHYNSLSELFKPFSIQVGLLTGSMTQKERRQVMEGLSDATIDFCIGTHALIQPEVFFQNLGLVITDEQHRFGVNQRTILTKKGNHPDILVMTATPIPRTLAVILYGDLDISAIDQMPPGRKHVITQSVGASGRDSAYGFLRKEVEKGRQAYIVAPLIEESTSLDAKSVTLIYKEISDRFRSQSIALLHGAMPQNEKERIMEEFYAGEIHILVSTVVIEVGINVPNATIMLIESAERFGLATLHQLRGRVGRGGEQSYCTLISDNLTELAKERAKILTETNDGFLIAEKDLELRGPGEFFGVKQHGIPELRLADLAKHIRILEIVRKEASLLLDKDPELSFHDHQELKRRTSKFFKTNETISI